MTDAHNDQQRSYFSERKRPRMAPDRAGTPYVKRQVRQMVDALGLQPGHAVLDLGCGPGKYTLAMADLGLAVEGLDLTPALLDELTAEAPDIPVHLADAAALPSSLHGRFDAVTGFFFLHHLEDLVPVFREVRKALRPGGRAGFLEPNPWFAGYYVQIAVTRGMTWQGERGILRMTKATLAAASREAGFGAYHDGAFGAMPPAIANRSWGRSIERGFESIPGWSRIGAFRLATVE
ncbi:MAG: class I SAM-dependent methyltransferase [Acidimicrobiia bacterium]|nr:class I SAM-dependent methyltransferase [Acidimicrobiia bacterium]